MSYQKYNAYGTTIHVYEFDPHIERFSYTIGMPNKLERLYQFLPTNKDEIVSAIVNWNLFDTGKGKNGYGEIEIDKVQIQQSSQNYPSFSFKDYKLTLGDLPQADIGAGYGATLTINGVIDIRNEKFIPHYNVKDARTAIGQKANSNIVFVCAEGDDTKNKGLNLKELAQFMLSLGCIISFAADGGGSTSMYVDGKPKYDQGRAIASAMICYKKVQKNLYKVTADKLNIRSSPSLLSTKIGQYSVGTIITIFEIKNDWGRSDKGWISLKYLLKL